jgi:glycosyltransferase involved in cell wall biosynthesis
MLQSTGEYLLFMNILLISPYFSPAVGGVETHLTDLCKYFEKRKHTVYVRTYKALGTKSRGATNENTKYVKIHRLWWPDFGLVFKLEPYPIPRVIYISLGLMIDCFLFLLTNAKNIDVVQIHGFIAALWGVPLAKLFGKRVVVNTHVGFKFDNESLMNTVTSWVLKKSDMVLALTKNAKEALLDIGVPEEKIAIYHYWVDQEKFTVRRSPFIAKQELGWGKSFTVLFVGRLVEVKGLDSIIKLANKMKEVQFVIAGSGPEEGRIKEQELRIKNLKFIGKVDQNDLPLYYNATDLLLIPSHIVKQTFEEGIPRVMIEALSCGTPVIATPSGGVPDVIDPSIGIQVRDSIEEMSRAIRKLQGDKKLLAKLSKNARPFAQKLFGEDKNAKIIEKSLT